MPNPSARPQKLPLVQRTPISNLFIISEEEEDLGLSHFVEEEDPSLSHSQEEEDPSLTSLGPSARSSEDDRVYRFQLALRVFKNIIIHFNYHLGKILGLAIETSQSQESIFQFSEEDLDQMADWLVDQLKIEPLFKVHVQAWDRVLVYLQQDFEYITEDQSDEIYDKIFEELQDEIWIFRKWDTELVWVHMFNGLPETTLRLESESQQEKKQAIESIKEYLKEQISQSSFRDFYVITVLEMMKNDFEIRIANMINHKFALIINNEQPSLRQLNQRYEHDIAFQAVFRFTQNTTYYLARGFYDNFHPQVEYVDRDVEDEELLSKFREFVRDKFGWFGGFHQIVDSVMEHLKCSSKPIEEHIGEQISWKIRDEFNDDEDYKDVFRRWANDLFRSQHLDGCPQTILGMKSCSNQKLPQATNTIYVYFQDKIMKDSFRDLYLRTFLKTMKDNKYEIKIANMINHELAQAFRTPKGMAYRVVKTSIQRYNYNLGLVLSRGLNSLQQREFPLTRSQDNFDYLSVWMGSYLESQLMDDVLHKVTDRVTIYVQNVFEPLKKVKYDQIYQKINKEVYKEIFQILKYWDQDLVYNRMFHGLPHSIHQLESAQEQARKFAMERIKEYLKEQISQSSFSNSYVRGVLKMMSNIEFQIAKMINSEFALLSNDQEPNNQASGINPELSIKLNHEQIPQNQNVPLTTIKNTSKYFLVI